jgi:biopolymer transport protein ExbB/TolQ
MQSQQCEHLVLESDREFILYRADGSRATTEDRLSQTQIQELLEEILPDAQRSLYASGVPVAFQYAYGDRVVNVGASQSDDNIRVSIAFGTAPTLAFTAPTSPMEPSVAEAKPQGSSSEAQRAVAPSETQIPPAKPPSLRAHPAFPHGILKSLRWSEAQIRMRSGIGGLALGLITSLAAALLAPKGSLLGQMFDLRNVTTVVPFFISCMFFWAASICWLRWRRLRDLERISSRSLLLEATQFLRNSTLTELDTELKGEEVQVSPLLRRLQAVVRQWLIRPSLQDADLILQQHVANDEEAVHAGYSLVKTFVWALPVLGLIGTVIGISMAVGGFASFLGGDIEDVGIVKQHLVGVTGGLSFAFLITLHGLLTSLLIMLPSSVLQTREEKLYTTIQHDIAETFLPVLQQVAPESHAVPSIHDVDVWREVLQQNSDAVLKAVQAQCSKVIEMMDERQQIHREQISAWMQEWQQLMEAGAGRLVSMINQVSTSMRDLSDRFVERFHLVQETFDKHTDALNAFVSAQANATSQQAGLIAEMSEHTQAARATVTAVGELTETTKSALAYQETLQAAMHQLNGSRAEHLQSMQATAGALASLTETTKSALAYQETLQAAMHQLNGSRVEHLQSIEATVDALANLTEATRSALTCQQTLQAAMQQLSDSNLHSTFAGFVEALSAQSQEMRAVATAMEELAMLTNQIQTAQATLQRAMSQLHETGLENTLATLCDSLASLGPVLASFREPFAWRAVPVGRATSEQG